jgi:hypothetical protein
VTVGRNRFIAPLSLLMARCASLIAPTAGALGAPAALR